MMRAALDSEYVSGICRPHSEGPVGQPSGTLARSAPESSVEFLGYQCAGIRHSAYRCWVSFGHQRISADSSRITWLQVAAASRDLAWLVAWGNAAFLFATSISESISP